MLALPLLRLAFDAVTALLRSWCVLPGIEAVIVKTLQVLLLVLALVLPISLLITLWMYEYLHGLALGRVQRFLKGLSRVPAVLVGLLGNWLISGNAQAHGSIWSMAALLTVMCMPFMISARGRGAARRAGKVPHGRGGPGRAAHGGAGPRGAAAGPAADRSGVPAPGGAHPVRGDGAAHAHGRGDAGPGAGDGTVPPGLARPGGRGGAGLRPCGADDPAAPDDHAPVEKRRGGSQLPIQLV